MSSTLPTRAELPKDQTWDLESVFATEADWRAALQALAGQLDRLASFEGRLSESGAVLFEALEVRERIAHDADRVRLYPSLQAETDRSNQHYPTLSAEAGSVFARLGSAAAYFEPELLALDAAVLESFVLGEPQLRKYQHFLDILAERKPHVRSAEVEAVLAEVSEPLSSTYRIHNATDADMRFRSIEANGNSLSVSHTNIGELLSMTDATVRRAAWEAYADGHLALQHTLAATLQGNIRAYAFNSRVRGYKSSLEHSLADNFVPVQVFDGLIETFKANLPTWHRFWRLRRKAQGGTLSSFDVPIYDSAAPLVPSTKLSFAEGAELIVRGMAPLGAEYVNAMAKGLRQDRWVDWGQNAGKRAGAFSSGSKGTHPFIFMSWSDDLYSMSTLAHELGHSMHSYLTNATQPFTYCEYSLFVAEVASNFNQAMVRAMLLREAGSREAKLAVLEEAFANFHRYLFVMPTLARFERELYERIEAGGAINAPFLSERIVALFSEGYGDAVDLDPARLGAGWMHFSHLYAPFYVYQYATGIAAANALAKTVLEEGEPAAKRYLDFLRAGSSLRPLDALRLAGIDMADPQSMQRGFDVLTGMVDELEALV